MGGRKKGRTTARSLAIEGARIAHDRYATDVVVLDLRSISPVTDYFVILTGTSDRQMRAVADEIVHAAADAGHRPLHVAGMDSAAWILLDFFDLVVHIFDDVHRQFYDLELIWGDAPRVRWQRPGGMGATAEGGPKDERRG